jgi:hypothetical protein
VYRRWLDNRRFVDAVQSYETAAVDRELTDEAALRLQVANCAYNVNKVDKRTSVRWTSS